MSNLRFSESAAFLAEKDLVTVVGLGGIGKTLAEKLSELGTPLNVWDGDVVEEHNCIPQNYGLNCIGEYKTKALLKELTRKSQETSDNINFYTKYFTPDSFITPIVFSCVDSIEARRIIFERWRSQEDRQAFIDGRLLTDFFQLFFITPETEQDYYNKYLDPNNEAVQKVEAEIGSCTNRQNSYTAGILQGLMIQKYINFITHDIRTTEDRNIEYIGAIDQFTLPH